MADEVTKALESMPESRGLAVLINLQGSPGLPDQDLFTDIFDHLGFSIYIEERCLDLIYALSYLIEYPTYSDYPIVVLVNGSFESDINVWGDYRSRINIRTDIIEPMLPPSAPHLADNPKIFLIHARSYIPVKFTFGRLEVPSEGNFIISYTNDWERSFKTLFELISQRCHIEDCLNKIQHIFPNNMRVISRLNKPVYLYC